MTRNQLIYVRFTDSKLILKKILYQTLTQIWNPTLFRLTLPGSRRSRAAPRGGMSRELRVTPVQVVPSPKGHQPTGAELGAGNRAHFTTLYYFGFVSMAFFFVCLFPW